MELYGGGLWGTHDIGISRHADMDGRCPRAEDQPG